MNSLNFQYWPRYVSRLIRINSEYRGDYIGWKVCAYIHEAPTQRDFEQAEKRPRPLWSMSDNFPWNIANRLSDFPFKDIDYTVKYANGFKVKSKLKMFDPFEASVFKGDRVMVLVGPDKGKVGIVGSVLKMRDLVIVECLNIMYVRLKDSGVMMRVEQPLSVKNEISLVDPQDNLACQVKWRYDEDGNRVRVSSRTGRLLPLPRLAGQLDDNVLPETAPISESKELLRVPKYLSQCLYINCSTDEDINSFPMKPTASIPLHVQDTDEATAVKATYRPRLCTFTDDILARHGVDNSMEPRRSKTYWY